MSKMLDHCKNPVVVWISELGEHYECGATLAEQSCPYCRYDVSPPASPPLASDTGEAAATDSEVPADE